MVLCVRPSRNTVEIYTGGLLEKRFVSALNKDSALSIQTTDTKRGSWARH